MHHRGSRIPSTQGARPVFVWWVPLNYHNLTLGVILFTIFGLIGYDIVVGTKTGGWDSISWVWWQLELSQPWIIFLFGFVCGHLTWQFSGMIPAQPEPPDDA